LGIIWIAVEALLLRPDRLANSDLGSFVGLGSELGVFMEQSRGFLGEMLTACKKYLSSTVANFHEFIDTVARVRFG